MLRIPDLQSFPCASLTAWTIKLVAYDEFPFSVPSVAVNEFGE